MEPNPVEIGQTVDTAAELERIIGEPFQPSVDKVIDHLDSICMEYIARSPFAIVASCDEHGRPEVSPRGDPSGFVSVLDTRHLAMPERPGNRRADTLHRLLENPNVALLFLIPGMGETLRVYGQAKIARDVALREKFSIRGKAPELVVVVRVERAMIHCPKCVIRSNLWTPDGWPSTEGLLTIGSAMKVHADLKGSEAALEEDARRAGMFELY